MSDAGPRRHTGKAGVGDQRNLLAKGQMLQRGCQLIRLLHSGAAGAAPDDGKNIPCMYSPVLDASDRVLFRSKDLNSPHMPVDPFTVQDRGVNGCRFDDRAFRRQISGRKSHRGGQSLPLRLPGTHNNGVGINAIRLSQAASHILPSLRGFPPVQVFSKRLACYRPYRIINQSQPAQMQHHFRNTACKKHADRRMRNRTVRQHTDQARHLAVYGIPVLDGWDAQPGGMGNGRQMEQQIRGPSKRRMNYHRIRDRLVGQNILHDPPAMLHMQKRAGRLAPHILPYRLSRRSQSGMGNRHAKRLGNHLGRRGGPQELAPAAGSCAGPASEVRRLFQGQLPIAESGSDALHFTGILPIYRRQRDSPRHNNSRQITHAGQCEHHRRQPFIAGGYTEHPFACGQRTD
ncbi:hypothetical protein D3C75_677130 [compost metagenome]